MDGRRKQTPLTIALALAVALPLATPTATRAQGQEASRRFRVLVPNLEPQGEVDKKFGEKVAGQLRELIDQLATHQAVDDKEVKQALRKFKLKEEDLNCIRARQLATQIDTELVMCGEYKAGGAGVEVSARFVSARTGEEFKIDAFPVGMSETDKAAQHIGSEFGKYVDQLRYVAFCSDYLASQQWENAMTACDRAISLNPESITARYSRAQALWKLERNEEALAEVRKVLEVNPIHESGLQMAGYLSAVLGNDEDARKYYSEYLELQPTDAAVRMKIAYDLAQAGDPVGAAGLIEEGLKLDSTDVRLHEQLGNFAMSAAAKIAEQAGGVDGNAPPPEAIELFQKALSAYGRVYAQKGKEIDPAILRNMIAANMSIRENNLAVELAKQAIQTHRDQAQLWSYYADALQKIGRLQDAIAALDSAAARDAEYPNISVRKGKWLLDEGRVNEALPAFREALKRNEQPGDVLAQLLIAHGHQTGVTTKNFAYAIRTFEQAGEFAEQQKTKEMLNFWLAYALYQSSVQQQEPQTVESAKKTLPQFQRALGLFENSRNYAASQPSINLAQFINAAKTYIEIQEAIIKRAG
ncbi:MAG: tetratricopeptide repeat protein [Gemmatimonadetes bacterium]|nr:tetratricopeptide repeat protein [Gemmatimonadota bacterium]